MTPSPSLIIDVEPDTSPVDGTQYQEDTKPIPMRDVYAARRKYGKGVDRIIGAPFLAKFTVEELIGPLYPPRRKAKP